MTGSAAARIDLPDLVPVPTVADLVRRGLATSIARDKQGVTTAAKVSPEGHRLMGDAMLENGRRLREHDAATRTTPREVSALQPSQYRKGMMPILNYSTTIAVEQSKDEIISALTRRGVTRISSMFDDDGAPSGIAFTMKTDYGFREFELPVRVEGVLRAMASDTSIPSSKVTPEQAARVAWRIAKVWLAAQSALIDADLASLDEVMMPYMVDNTGRTMYSIFRGNAMKELGQ